MTDKILVFIPCYNCEAQIVRVLGQFTPEISKNFSEILVLDNQSKDSTLAKATQAAANSGLDIIKIAKNKANYNLGGSHKAAFTYAANNNFTHVVVLHGDDQGRISDLLPVLESGMHRINDACLGARFMAGSVLKGYSKFRIFGNYVFNILFSIGSLSKVYDLGSGLNIFSRSFFTEPQIVNHSDDLRFNVYLLLSALDRHRKLKYFPITWSEDDQVSNVKMTSQALKTLSILFEFIFQRNRFRSTDHRDVKHITYEFEVLN